MRRFFLLFLFFISFLKADYLYANKNRCIDDFYYKDGYLYYHYSKDTDDDTYYKTYYKNQNILPGYFYDEDNNTCRIDNTAVKLGITSVQYYFLMGLAGLLLGIVIVFGFARAFM